MRDAFVFFYISPVFYKKQYSLLLLEITHARCLKHARKNLPGSLREQFCNPIPIPPVGRKPLCMCGVGGTSSAALGEEEGPRKF